MPPAAEGRAAYDVRRGGLRTLRPLRTRARGAICHPSAARRSLARLVLCRDARVRAGARETQSGRFVPGCAETRVRARRAIYQPLCAASIRCATRFVPGCARARGRARNAIWSFCAGMRRDARARATCNLPTPLRSVDPLRDSFRVTLRRKI